MKIQALVSTMNHLHPELLVGTMNLKHCLIVNQVTRNEMSIPKNIVQNGVRTISLRDKGLSRSRNLALSEATADICIISDDDMAYDNNYESIILDGYRKYPDADIIVFRVDNSDGTTRQLRAGRVDFLHSMKVCSVQISFRNKSIHDKHIRFNNRFGTGTENYMGEENIFLADCLKSGLKIYSHPIKISSLTDSNSTWFKGYDTNYFYVKGKVFHMMSRRLAFLLSLQFAIRKHGIYKKSISFMEALASMKKGIYDQRNK